MCFCFGADGRMIEIGEAGGKKCRKGIVILKKNCTFAALMN